MDEFREGLELILFKHGFESPNEHASDAELLQMVREACERIEDLEEKLKGQQHGNLS